jgi:hypothetical protein
VRHHSRGVLGPGFQWKNQVYKILLMNPQIYRLSPKAAEKAGARVKFVLATVLLVFGVPTVALQFYPEFATGKPLLAGMLHLSLAIAFLMAIFGWIIYRSNRQRRKVFSSYQLIMGEEEIRRTLQGWPDVALKSNEVSNWQEAGQSGFRIEGGEPKRKMFVPIDLENYESCKQYVASRYPQAATETRRWNKVVSSFFLIVMIACFLALFIAGNTPISPIWKTWLARGALSILFPLMLWIEIALWRNATASKHLKWVRWSVTAMLLGFLYGLIQVWK